MRQTETEQTKTAASEQTDADAKLLCSEDLVCPVEVVECVLHVVDGAEHVGDSLFQRLNVGPVHEL